MPTEQPITPSVRLFRTERYSGTGQRYCRMACPAGVSMTSIVTLVPMEHTQSYFTNEIASEGRWRSGVPIIVILPGNDAGTHTGPHWFNDLYSQMWRVREREAPPLFKLRNGTDIDIGIVDIQIALHVPDGMEGMIPHLIESETFSHENFDFLDYVTAKKIHNRMVFASAFHNYHSSGSFHYHFHNLIFGMRKEIRETDEKESIGTIDLIPMLDALNEHHDQNVISGLKAATAHNDRAYRMAGTDPEAARPGSAE